MKSKKNKEKFVIIGNGVSAISAAQTIREKDKVSPITIITKEPYFAYSRPLISYFMAGKVTSEKMYYRNAQFYKENNVELLLSQEVKKILPHRKSIILANKKKIPYTKLLIACGGKPVIPPIKGTDRENVFTFTSWDEVKRLSKAVKKSKKAVVIGGGMIGLKACESLAAVGLEVTIVELADKVLSTVLDKEASSIVHKHLEENNVEIIVKNTVEKITGKGKTVEEVILKNGRKIKTDLVVIAVGVIPDLTLTKAAGIKTNKGIFVDKFMQTNIPCIYAAGDVCEAYDFILKEKRPIPVWPLAYEQGEIAGANMREEKIEYQGGLVLNSVDVFDLPIITAGISAVCDSSCEIFVKFLPERKIYKKVIVQKGKIIGSILISDIERAGIITGMLKDKLDVDNFKNEILEDTFGYIYVPKESRAKEISPLEI